MSEGIKDNGSQYWENIILLWTLILLSVWMWNSFYRTKLISTLNWKKGLIGPLDIYLGGNNKVTVWTLSVSQYVQAAVKSVEK